MNRMKIDGKTIQVVNRSQTITANTTLMPEGYGGWIALNIGTGNVKVDGFLLRPNMAVDLSHLPWYVVWSSPIPIEVEAGGALRITRLKYNVIDERKEKK